MTSAAFKKHVWLSFILLLVCVSASAQIAPRHDDPLRAKTLGPVGFSATPAPEDVTAIAGEISPSVMSAIASFKADAGSNWSFYIDRRSGGMSMVRGQGVRWVDGEPSIPALEAKARALMTRHPALFNVPESELVLDQKGSLVFGENNQYASIVFNQVINGIPVADSRIGFYVSHGNLVMFGVDRIAAADVPIRSVTPSVPADLARLAFVAYVGGLQAGDKFYHDAELQWVLRGKGDTVATGVGFGWDHYLVYRFVWSRGPISNWEALVSATTGEVLRFRDFNTYASSLAKASVLTVSNCLDPLTCNISAGLPDTGENGPMVPGNYPGSVVERPVTMPYLKLNFAGAVCAGDACYTNGGGAFDYPSGAQAVAASLEGKYFRIADACGASATAGAAASPNGGGFDFGTSNPVPFPANVDCAPGTVQSSPGTLPNNAGPGNTHSARSIYYHLNLIAAKSRFFLPHNNWLKGAGGPRGAAGVINVTSNLPPACNAMWLGLGENGTLNFMRYTPGLSCNNTGELVSVFLHEYGHGLDQNDGSGSAPENGTGEAMGDIFAVLEAQKPCVGDGFILLDPGLNFQYWSNKAGYGSRTRHCSGVRSVDYREFCKISGNDVVNCAADPRNGSRSGTNPGSTTTSDAGTPARSSTMGSAASNFYVCSVSADYRGPLGLEGHCESAIASQSIWDLTKMFISEVFGGNIYNNPPTPTEVAGWQYMDRLWYLTRDTALSAYTASGPSPTGVTSGCAASTWYAQYSFIDDDNGNLADGTPNADLMFRAFDSHGIACGTASDPSNLSSGRGTPPPAPALNTCPTTTAPIQFSWTASPGATKYRILRNTMGCGFGFSPLKTVSGSHLYFEDGEVAPGVPYYYAVQSIGASDSEYGFVSPCLTITPQACPTTTAPAAPTGTSATASGNNQITFNWTPNGAAQYKVLRKDGNCSSTSLYSPIGVVAAPPFVDDYAVIGSKQYSYQVVGTNAACASCGTSVASACATATAVGSCLLPPTFGGVTSVVAGTGSCRMTVNWAAATSNCAAPVFTYSVYRDTTKEFLPGPGNLIASGVTGTQYIDTGVTGGTKYYYIVRATDALGNTDRNTLRRFETATGPVGTTAFTDNAQGTLRFASVPIVGGADWVVLPAGTLRNSPHYGTQAGNYATGKCQSLVSDTMSLGLAPTLNFASMFNGETGNVGGIVQIATEAGGFNNWQKLAIPTYNGVMNPGLKLPCNDPGFGPGERAFTIETGLSVNAQFLNYSVPLTQWAGQRVKVRFLFSSENATAIAHTGFLVDDVSVVDSKILQACTPSVPLVAGSDAATAVAGAGSTIDVLTNDVGGNGGRLTVSLPVAGRPASGTATVNTVTGTITYTPDATFTGTDTFTYEVTDGSATSTGTVTVTVNPAPAIPVRFNHAAMGDYTALGAEPIIKVDRRVNDTSLPAAERKDHVYVDSPFGLSTTVSLLFKSIDGGDTFLPLGTPIVRDAVVGPGGGDAHHDFDAKHRVYFNDLSGGCVTAAVSNDGGNTFPPDQTNFLNCFGTGAPTAPTDDRQWIGAFGDGRAYSTMRNLQGSNFFLFKTSDAGKTWDAGRVLGTVGQSGALVVDDIPRKVMVNGLERNAYLSYQIYDENGNIGMFRITDLDDGTPLTWDDKVIPHGGGGVHNVFPVLAVDTAGNVYVSWSSLSAVYLMYSTDRGNTWSPRFQISAPGGSNIMPWLVAGDPGRIDLIWYRSNMPGNPNNLNQRWDIYMAQSVNLFGTNPTFTTTRVNDTTIHTGEICLAGLSCNTSVPQRDRSFLEYPSIDFGSYGEAFIVFNQNTNQVRATHIWISKQTRGPSLYESVGTLTGPTGSVTIASPAPNAEVTTLPLVVSGTHVLPPGNFDKDEIADAFFPDHGPAYAVAEAQGLTANLNQPGFDIRKVALSDDATHVTLTMEVSDLTVETLAAAPAKAGGTGVLLLTQWQMENPTGDGTIYWAGVSIRGGQPQYLTGTIGAINSATSNKYMTYAYDPQKSLELVGTMTNTAPGTITIKIPRAQIDRLSATNKSFFHVTGLALAEVVPMPPFPTSAAPAPSTLPIKVDATAPVTYVVGTGPAPDGVVEYSIDDPNFTSPITAGLGNEGNPVTAGKWQSSIASLANGTHTLYARQVVGGGAPSAPTSVTFTVNSTAPQAGALSLSSPTISVGEAGGSVSVNVSRTGGSDGAISVSFTTTNGTATAGSDFTATSGSLNWADGETASKSIAVPILDDSTVEGVETFNITLSNPTNGAALGVPATTVATITDDDSAQVGTVQFSSATYLAGEADGTATISVTRTGGSSGAVSVAYATSNGTATAGDDYTSAGGTLSWADGESATKTFTVMITNDNLGEASETINLTLSNATGGVVIGSPNPAVLTINDDEGLLITSINPASACQGGPEFTMTVNGDGFVAGSVVQVNGAARQTTFDTAQRITARILASDLANAGNLSVRVVNPNNAMSNAVNLSVGPDTTAPAVTAPGPITVMQSMCTASGNAGASGQTSAAVAQFLVGGSALDTCSSTSRLAPQASGADATNATTFTAGTTTVTFRYRDVAGNIGTATSTVTVKVLGDLDGDGTVGATDLVTLANHLVGNVTAPADVSDVNRDGKIDAIDIVMVANHLVGNITCLSN